jgi:hypothetical protein
MTLQHQKKSNNASKPAARRIHTQSLFGMTSTAPPSPLCVSQA